MEAQLRSAPQVADGCHAGGRWASACIERTAVAVFVLFHGTITTRCSDGRVSRHWAIDAAIDVRACAANGLLIEILQVRLTVTLVAEP